MSLTTARRFRLPMLILPMLFAGVSALAAEATPAAPQGVVSLSSSASVEVTRDLLSVTMNVTKEGSDAASVQSQIKQALDAALGEARKVAKPGQLEVQTGNFSLYPRYSQKGLITNWIGSTELLIEGRDLQAIGQLSGRISTMTIARVAQNISRELREKTEGEAAAEAIARYRAKAADYARQFGYAGYVIREVNVAVGDAVTYAPQPMLREARSAVASDEALPVEAGKGLVTVSVNGTVQMK